MHKALLLLLTATATCFAQTRKIQRNSKNVGPAASSETSWMPGPYVSDEFDDEQDTPALTNLLGKIGDVGPSVEEVSNSGPGKGPFFSWNVTQSSPIQITPWSVPVVGHYTRFNLSVFDPMQWSFGNPKGLQWNQLHISHLRKVHVIIASQDLTTFGHLHPEDFEEWNGDGLLTTPQDLSEFVMEYKFPRSGRYVIVVEYQVVRDGHEEDGTASITNPVEGLDEGMDEDVTPVGQGGPIDDHSHEHSHGHDHSHKKLARKSPRHSHSDGTTVDVTALAYLDVQHVEGAPKPRPMMNLQVSEHDSKFHGIPVQVPFNHRYVEPLVPLDLAKPVPKFTKNVTDNMYVIRMGHRMEDERVFGGVDAQLGHCSPLFFEFSKLEGDREVPMDNLTPLLEATSHVTIIHESLTHAEHVHTLPLSLVDVTKLCPQQHDHQGFPPLTFGPVLVTSIDWKRAGMYRMFVQASVGWGHDRVLLNGAFWIHVNGSEMTGGIGGGKEYGEQVVEIQGGKNGWIGFFLIAGTLVGVGALWKSNHRVAVNVPKSRLRGYEKTADAELEDWEDLETARLKRDVVFQLEDAED